MLAKLPQLVSERSHMAMQVTQTGTIKIIECTDFNEAQTKAGQEAANTAGFPVPVVVFQQGKRLNLSGALPFSFVASRLMTKSATKKATLAETADKMNRPEIPEHARAIANYIMGNQAGTYILPPLTLNIQQEVNLYTASSPARVRTGFLVLHATSKLAITDGQHRRTAIVEAIENSPSEQRQELEADGIGVMITCETNVDQIHQDFADCSKTKPLPPSQLAVYDRRNPANRLVIDLAEKCPLFKGKIDATSVTLGKNSISLFLANQLRQFVKTLLTGNWQMADAEFEKQAKQILDQEGTYEQELARFVEFVQYLSNIIPVWKKIASLQPGVESNQIPALRREPGYVCMSVTGLVVIARIGHELFRDNISNWKVFADRLGRLDWQKDADLWIGNLVRDGKIVNNQKLVRDATIAVRKAIDWEPTKGVADEAAEVAANEPAAVASTELVEALA
jgi:DNA sulfur modification protein DndB